MSSALSDIAVTLADVLCYCHARSNDDVASWWALQPKQHWLTAVPAHRLSLSSAAAAHERPAIALLPKGPLPDLAQPHTAMPDMTSTLAALSADSNLQQVGAVCQLFNMQGT